MNSKTKILVTGASSDLMNNFIEKIDKENYEIFAITRQKKNIYNKLVHVFEGDICDLEFAKNATKGIQIIIHAAAVTHKFKASDYFQVNVQGTINLVNAAKLNQVEKFIFISSRTAVPNGGAYGESKLQAEQYLKANFNNWLIFRPSEVFGIGKQEGIQKLISDIAGKKFILCPLNVKSKLYPIHADDVTKIMFDFIFIQKSKNQTVTINGKTGFSYFELVRLINKIYEGRVIIIPVPKAIMYLGKWMIEKTGIQIGMVPDQIPRLYCSKEIQNLDYYTISIEDYIRRKKNFKKYLYSKFCGCIWGYSPDD